MTPRALLEHMDRGTPWPDQRADGDVAADGDLASAYRDALAVRALRTARGERVVGYKAGFTNRTIWARYGVFAPIWGPVYDTTVAWCDDRGTVDLSGTCQPRLEPECVFGLSATPPDDPTLDALFDCVDWFASGFEVVQSHAPGWRFHAAETCADGGLHARLLVGAKTPVRDVAATGTAFDAILATTRVALLQGDAVRDTGVGANVLDGTLHALRDFVRTMHACAGATRLRPGDFVTTGTWTDAWPVAPGEAWSAAFEPPMRPLAVTFR